MLKLSALGIYFHAVFLSITLGFPIVIIALLLKYSKTGDEDYFKAARIMTAVLAVNFALGAITGTLVEFGLIQAWPGTILAIASFAFAPLALELVAFTNEIATLVLFIVTLGKIKTRYSIAILTIYWVFAVLSGVLIMSVNSWLVAPYGTGGVAKVLYPFMPEFGSTAVDVQKLVALKILALASGMPIQAIIQNPNVAEKVGVILSDPYVAITSPFAVISALHALFAAFLVGTSIALLAFAYRYTKTKEERHLKVVKVASATVFVLFLIQPTIFGHFMGEAVVHNNPTKFAMMENAEETFYNPMVALLAYGDPSKPIVGFDEFERRCNELENVRLGDVATKLGLDRESLIALASSAGVSLKEETLSSTLNLELKTLCLSDLAKARERITAVHAAYYTKIAFGVLGFVSAIALFGYLRGLPVISRIVEKVLGARSILALSVLVFLGSAVPSVLGWYVREVGRKPWTVYGLLYPEELVTVVGYGRTPEFAALMAITITIIVLFGVLAMYLVATREYRFLDLLRGGGNE
ncbi:MAG: cytochrome ubiquinol oxidase subunit I [Archaeoglobaceae archaeon]